MFLADRDQLFERHFRGKADDLVIAGVDFKQQRGFFVYGIFVVRWMRAIGTANFFQNRSALGHDFGNAKRAADFDQLAARNDHFFAFGQRVQAEQNRRGVVVHHRCSFSAGEMNEQLFERFLSFAAFAHNQVVFQIDRVIGHGEHRVDGGL